MDRLDFVYKNRLEPVVVSDFDKVMTMYDLLKDYKNYDFPLNDGMKDVLDIYKKYIINKDDEKL